MKSKHYFTWVGLYKTIWPVVGLAGLLFVLGLVLVLIPTKPVDRGSFLPGIISLAIGSLAFLIVPWKYLRRIEWVKVNPEGLAWRTGGAVYDQRWSDVCELYRQEIHNLVNGAKPSDWNRKSKFKLVFSDDSTVHFNHVLSKFDKLASFIEESVKNEMLPRAKAALTKTGISFGDIQLSREALIFRNDRFAWRTINKVWIGNGHFGWQTSRGTNGSVTLAEIPNYVVMLALIRDLAKPGAVTYG